MRRQRIAVALLAVLSITILISTRYHLYELSQVSKTYATFHSYFEQHDEIVYRYPVSTIPNISTGNSSKLVPAIIHQVFLTDRRPSSLVKYEAAITSCRAMHPTWTHGIWTDEAGSAFIQQYYPSVWPHYTRYKRTVQRANILRYALLDHFGGVYLDLDVTCLQPLDSLRHVPWLAPGAYPVGLSNGFMLSRPHHPFWKYLLAAVPSKDLTWGLPYVETMLSTGCMFLSNRWMDYVSSLSKQNVNLAGESVYVLADELGQLSPHMLRGAVATPMFRHGGASSWHEWDAAAIVLIGKHYLFFAVLVIGALLAAALVCRFPRRKHTVRRKWCETRPLRKCINKTLEYDPFV